MAVIASIAIVSVSAATALMGSGNTLECTKNQYKSNITKQCGKWKKKLNIV